ncbi:MAG: DEAD/DEAH box helicase family protein [Actinomycetota bacterium]|nr:DEAD/DEAH box helicase family protein [Actinomycetota bacterium]
MDTEGREGLAELSSAAQTVRSAIPPDGASIGNARLRAMTGLDDPVYRAAVEELVGAGLVRRGRGRGGSLALVDEPQGANGSGDTLAEPRPRERSSRQRPATGDEAAPGFDPGALAGPGGLFEKIRAHVSTDVGRGLVFQRLMKAYLSEDPLFVERFSRVWQWSEWPGRPPDEGDTGIDLVAQERDGGLCAIQCKFYAPSTTIGRDDIDRFLVASGKRPFTARLFVSTTERWGRYAEKVLADQAVPVQRIGIAELAASPFDWSRFDPENPEQLLRRARHEVRPHQRAAIDDCIKGFSESDRGKLVMACGTGKTFTALKLAEETVPAGGVVCFCVPSISLLAQSLRAWSADAARPLHAMAVCSDAQVTKDDEDLHVYDLALPATTDPERIAEHLALARKEAQGEENPLVVVFSTYQSLDRVAAAQALGAPGFDLVICDEAHRTTGAFSEDKGFSGFTAVHDEERFRARRRLYMTATPRLYSDAVKEKAREQDVVLCSMDTERLYGPTFHTLGFGEAVEAELLSDYKVVVLMVDEAWVNEVAHDPIADHSLDLILADAARLAGIWRGLSKESGDPSDFGADAQPMRRAVAFSTTIAYSKRVAAGLPKVVDALVERGEEGVACEARHVDGTMGALVRDQALAWLREAPPEGSCRVLTNARCLTEGVDVPALDAVIFTNPRASQIDVVQAVGRVMRRTEDKRYGYVIIPVPVPAHKDPEEVLDDHKAYKVVWQVLQALRAHDDRFEAEVNRLDLQERRSERIRVVGVGRGAEASSTSARSAKVEQLTLAWQGLEDKVYARIVRHVGSRVYWESWAEDVARIAQAHITRITTAIASPGAVRDAFERYLEGLRQVINPAVTSEEAVEMLAEHLVTAPVFEALFGDATFTRTNPVSVSMADVLTALHEEEAIDQERQELSSFYASVRMRVENLDNLAARQKVVKDLYETFFRRAFPKVADRLGIVYTPIEIVDFMLKSVDAVLRSEFQSHLGAHDVHVLEPFCGTGTFVARLLAMLDPADLDASYRGLLHANEIVLLAYYVAAVNIEQTYHALRGDGDYEPFPGIVLTDTFQLGEGTGQLLPEFLRPNSERARRQQGLPITVVIGNPPYSVGQGSQNDNNQNLRYPKLDERIEQTYAARSSAGLKRNLYDSYIRAFRWATDRIGERGVVCFVTNGAFIDSGSADGFRKTLADEFSSIWCLNLRGNQRTQGETSRREGGKIFGSGSRTPVAITLLVKNPEHTGPATICYHDIGDYLSREDKLGKLVGFGKVSGVGWQAITPNAAGDWINQRSEIFETFEPLGDKGGGASDAIFSTYSLGIVTARDAWAYNFSREALMANMAHTIAAYNAERERFHAAVRESVVRATDEAVNGFVDTDPTRVSWTVNLKSDLRRNKPATLDPDHVVPSMYRPFCKQWLYFDRQWNERVLLMPRLFPTPAHENRVIAVSGVGAGAGYSVLLTDAIPCLTLAGAGNSNQCFPRYRYTEVGGEDSLFAANTGYERHDAISARTLDRYRERYGDKVTADNVFDYVYGLLYSPEYTTRFAAELGKMIPRIPMVEDFWAFADAGAKLARWHLGYETVDPWPLDGLPDQGADPKMLRVEKMRFASKGDRSTVVVNHYVTLSGIPDDAHRYQVNGRSAVEWILDRYQVKTDKASGIVNDPNTWSKDPRYIVDLLARIVRVSMESVAIIEGLPPLGV